MPPRTILAFVAAVVLVAAAFAAYLIVQEPGPVVIIRQPTAIGGQTVEVNVAVDPHGGRLATFEAWIEQDGRRRPVVTLSATPGVQVVQESPERLRVTRSVATRDLLPLADGQARLVVEASRLVLFGLREARTVRAQDIPVRLAPPSIAVLSIGHYVRLGGSEMVVYRVTPPDSVSGVAVGERFYRGYPASGVAGAGPSDPAVHVAFFALPFDADLQTPIRVRARDAAGNIATAEFDHRTFDSAFTASRVTIDDRFLSRVVPPVVANTPGLALPVATADERLAAFLRINGDVRVANSERLSGLAAETSPEWLAQGAFRRLGGSKAEAPFAEHRTYFYRGEEIDQQVHLGFDLASTRGAAVAASNTGRVVFAGYLGIYGTCVALDHGMGVQTLYGHLSAADVERGDRVAKGETIGRSGSTGVAGGDHLHFTVLVGGTPVNPIEWWDPHWVRDRIERKLAAAGIRQASAAGMAR